jgi:hypothetical protein
MALSAPTEFRVGELYTNDQIRFALGLENLGGIRPSVDNNKSLRHVAIMTIAEESERDRLENPYRDRIEGDVLTYTAQGREGDQQLTGRNKRLLEQYATPVPFFGFINMGRQTYRFLGLLELLRHSQETQFDRRGTSRKVWLFEFRVHPTPEVVPIAEAVKMSASLLSESRKQNPLTELEREVTDLPAESKEVALTPSPLQAESVRGQLMQITPVKFEHFIKALMEVNGFTSVSVTAASGDGGIDINAYVDEANDFFAGSHVQAQVKRWRHAVGSPDINNFRGALNTTAKGVFITTSHYTRAAILEARHKYKPCITLIDGTRLSGIVLRSSLTVDGFL